MAEIQLGSFFDIEKTDLDTDELISQEDANEYLINLITQNIPKYQLPITVDVTIDDESTKAQLASLYFDFLRSGNELGIDFPCYAAEKSYDDEFSSVRYLFNLINEGLNDNVYQMLGQVIDEDNFSEFVEMLEFEGVAVDGLLDFEKIKEGVLDFLFENSHDTELSDVTFEGNDYVEVMYSPFDMSYDYLHETFDLVKNPEHLAPVIELLKMLSILPSELSHSNMLSNEESSIDSNVIAAAQETTFTTDFPSAKIGSDDFFELAKSFAYNEQVPAFMFYLSIRDLMKRDSARPFILDSSNMAIVTHDGRNGSSDSYEILGNAPLHIDLSSEKLVVSKMKCSHTFWDVCGVRKREYQADEVSLARLYRECLLEDLITDSAKQPSELDAQRYNLYIESGIIKEVLVHEPGNVKIGASYSPMMAYVINNHPEAKLTPPTPELLNP